MGEMQETYGPLKHALDILDKFDERFLAFSGILFSDEIKTLYLA